MTARRLRTIEFRCGVCLTWGHSTAQHLDNPHLDNPPAVPAEDEGGEES